MVLFEMKTCHDCRKEKHMTQFYKNASMADGRVNICISCKNKAVARRKADPQEISRLMHQWAMLANQEEGLVDVNK